MTTIITILGFLLLFPVTNGNAEAPAKPYACHFFSYANAEKLLGQKVTGVDGDENKNDGAQRWSCTFTAASGEGKIHFVLLKDLSEDAARHEFQVIRTSNQKRPGFENWPGVGDEAVVHTDGKSFQFIMVRKDTRTLRIKMNPLSGSSLDDLKAVAVALTEKLKSGRN